ncbi:histidine phosphatase family protein [Marinobacter zhanjiangensis]|uniref:histidine phosphatase family protein n=1 Tax=Marinobacter zhanjiangensis TaxID=578215 RepID=UPI0016775120|nr:histidine phosphatase family protein [Marinobacter zhanjiangensis]
MTSTRWFSIGLALVLVFVLRPAIADETEAWQALRDGRAVLMLRHALAPGTGDPADFDLEDCSTQRDLNARGREQARAWKSLMSRHGIDRARVYTSQWCRSRHTAEEMGIGPVTEWPPLNSFFGGQGDGERQTRQTIAAVNALDEGLPVVLVSHQVNITRLTGVYPSSNEGVILSLPLSESPTVFARVSP